MSTTIQITEELQQELMNKKLYQKETYEEVIWNLLEDTKELSQETKKEIVETTFTPVSFPAGLGTRNHIAICKSFPSILYISKYSGSGITVYKSTDGGLNYSQISTGTDFNGGQAWYDFYMHVNPFDPNYAYVGSIDIWRTTDGNTFTNNTNGYSGGNVHVDQHNMDFHPTDPNICIAVNDGGIWYSTNKGDSWLNRNAGLTLTQFYRMTSDPSNAAHHLGGTQDNGTQRTTGAMNWAAAFGGDGGEVCFHPNNPMYILGETQNNGVFRSVNPRTPNDLRPGDPQKMRT